jgi:membrane protein
MLGKLGRLIKSAAVAYVDDNCLSRGAAIAYYVVFALTPVLLIVVAVAGVLFGSEEARGALVDRIAALMGKQGADTIQAMLAGASHRRSGLWASLIGLVTLVVAASGVFTEIQSTLNAIWRAKPRQGAIWALVRARLLSLALVFVLGLLLMLSLIVSTALTALSGWVARVLPDIGPMLRWLNSGVSLALITALFAAIYKVLPDTDVAWRDVGIGAVVTALLMAVGKYLIALYIGTSTIATTYGAAGALAALFVWIYYCSQIFLFGAEFTRCFAAQFGSWRDGPPTRPVKGAAHEIKTLKERLEVARLPQ